ncbi:MAG: SEL1-like repeat protein [Verrucomicrobia bacterium]|nr:SEL1-like repeat protein [Verrucomicrobiota bacterium]
MNPSAPSPPGLPRRYAIAFSFPGERREYVERVARALLPAFGGETDGKARIFYDAWHEEPIIGYNTARKLQQIYAHDADLVVPFYCQDYLNKKWCGVELRAIEALLYDQQFDRVLPFRFDLVDIPSSFKTDVFPVVTNRPPEEIAALILARYNALQQTAFTLPERPPEPPPRLGNLRPATPLFVGRERELAALEAAVFAPPPRRVVVAHGFGGMGKTELAVAFADRHAAKFPAGLWMLGAEGKQSLLPLLGELAPELGLPASAGPDESAEQRGRCVLAELHRRASAARETDPDGGAACLLVLDNVSERALLAEPQRAALAGADWLQILATTRLSPADLRAGRGQGLAFVPVDTLEPEAALDLLRRHQPDGQWPAATASGDEAAARELVHELGGFTLTLESVALYLGLHPDIRPAAYLKRLRKEGLPSADALGADPDVATQTRHREKQLALVLDATLQKLAPAERATLDYAALLPPDNIPWPWLRAVVARELPDALREEEGYPDPWLGIRSRLEGLRLLTPTNHPELARLHRMVAAQLREGLSRNAAEMLRRLRTTVERFALALEDDILHAPAQHVWQVAPLEEAVRHWRDGEQDTALGHIAGVVGTIEATLGRLDVAGTFLGIYHETAERNLAANPESAQTARDVSVSLERLGDFLASRGLPGDAEKALGHYQRSLEVRERLLLANPESAQAARDVSVSLNKLADSLANRGLPGDAEKALGHYQRSLEVSERLLLANPESAQAARDVSVSLNKLADSLANRGLPGDAEKALGHYQRSLAVAERLLQANPESAQAARDVSVSLERLGDFLASRGLPGDAEKALGHYQRSLEVSERLLLANPESAQAARDVSVSLDQLADFLASRGLPGDAEKALGHYQRSLAVAERLLQANPDSAQAARDVSVSLERLGDFLARRGLPGDAETALGHYQRSLEVSERLLVANPESAQAARDVSVSLNKLGDFLARRGLPGDAETALGHYQRSLEVRERLLVANPESASVVRDVVVSHFKLAQFGLQGGNQALAMRHFGECHRLLHARIAVGVTFDPPIMNLYQQLHAAFGGGA